MKYKLLNTFSILLAASLALTSCIKDDVDDLTTEGDSFVKILESPEKKLFFSPFTDVRTVDLFSLRKDAANSASLNTASSVKVTMNPTAIEDYNAENGTHFEVLPDSLYTLVDPATKVSATEYKFDLAAGQAAKEFSIKLNGAKWDLSHSYAMAFTIADSAGLNITEGKRDVMVFLAVKNKYDGIYEVTGSYVDATNGAFVAAYPYEWELQTTGPNQCMVVDNVNLGFPGFLFETAAGSGSFSYYGNFGLLVNFDPVTDKIVSVTNYYGQPASNTRSAQLDPTGANQYDASSKTINIKYFMLQPSAVPAPPNIRASFNETWRFVKDR
ncbi:protein of unknown function [Cnuella takakiae]|uniref:BT-3987-like N-terminal domain-containing protein n=1 Tax=Cnuella takakiae TaxID=1302690 RepID=A0A1M5C1G7_9BACT|nr:DUF1735 domain-containing protein [Cnuella takakiae]OLY93587.1 hypothetical protein BUE76_18190 [Cnuella takakiae]SHF48515.1 protein of unknown function [Cnuella takakiae]